MNYLVNCIGLFVQHHFIVNKITVFSLHFYFIRVSCIIKFDEILLIVYNFSSLFDRSLCFFALKIQISLNLWLFRLPIPLPLHATWPLVINLVHNQVLPLGYLFGIFAGSGCTFGSFGLSCARLPGTG